MSQITKTGTFRGIILDAGIATTKNGFPQWIAQLQATEFYDEETKQWVDWTSYEEKHITAYTVLFGGEGRPLLSFGQLQKAVGWSGVSFSELTTMDYSQVNIQWRVETNLYEGVTSLQVKWIDAYDAEPGRAIQKLGLDKVKELDAKYANALRQASGGPKPKKVQVFATAIEAQPETLNRAITIPTPVPAKVKNKKTKTPPALPLGTGQEPLPLTCTKEEAWNSAYEVKDKDVTDDQIAEIWLKTIETMGGEKAIMDWSVIRDAVIEQVKDEIPF
jgi:hypothetical protein